MKKIFILLLFTSALFSKPIYLECKLEPTDGGIYDVNVNFLDVTIDSDTTYVSVYNKQTNETYKNKGIFSNKFILLKKYEADEDSDETYIWEIDRKTLFLKKTMIRNSIMFDLHFKNFWGGNCKVANVSNNLI